MAGRILFHLLLALPCLAATGAMAVTGSIPCMGKIELAGAPFQMGLGNVAEARLTADENHLASVVLRLRTNCDFNVSLRLRDSLLAGARVVSGTASPVGGTRHLTGKALQTQVKAVEIPPGLGAICVEGPAVSRGGNDLTPDNVMQIELLVRLPEGVHSTAADLFLRLGTGRSGVLQAAQ
jgi:hypothetical protein